MVAETNSTITSVPRLFYGYLNKSAQHLIGSGACKKVISCTCLVQRRETKGTETKGTKGI